MACLALDKWADEQAEKRNNVVQQLLFSRKMPLMSFTALAHATGHSRARVICSIRQTAAALQISADISWATPCANIAEILGAEGSSIRGILLLTNTRYDETPSRMRVRSSGVFQSKQETCVAKVFQIEYGLTMLFQHKQDGRTIAMTGMVPRMLAVLDHTTAENIRQVLESRCHIPELNRMARHFEWRLRCVCTDRYSANFAAEAAMQSAAAENNLGYSRDHTACEVHMVATAQARAFELPALKIVVEGILAVGLTMTAARATQRFRQSLKKAFDEHLTIVPGQPPRGHAKDFREALYDQFLPLFPNSQVPATRSSAQNARWA